MTSEAAIWNINKASSDVYKRKKALNHKIGGLEHK